MSGHVQPSMRKVQCKLFTTRWGWDRQICYMGVNGCRRQTGQLDPVIDLISAACASQAPSFGGASGMDRMSAFDNLNSAFGDVLPQAAVPQVKPLVP